MRYLNLFTDRRPIDIQALVGGEFFADPETAKHAKLALDHLETDAFDLGGSDPQDLIRFLQGDPDALRGIPELLDQLDRVLEQLGLPPLNRSPQPVGYDPALAVEWALSQQNEPSKAGRRLGRMGGPGPSVSRSPSGGGGAAPTGTPASGTSGSVPTQAPAPAGSGPGADRIQAALDFARGHVGAPYVGGGSPFRFGEPGDGRTYQMQGQRAYVSPKGVVGFDCSGFVVAMFKQAGVDLKTQNTNAMFDQLPRVAPNEIQPGDLIVKRGHVAVYLGDGQMIEAAPPGVKISDASRYLNNSSYEIRRVDTTNA